MSSRDTELEALAKHYKELGEQAKKVGHILPDMYFGPAQAIRAILAKAAPSAGTLHGELRGRVDEILRKAQEVTKAEREKLRESEKMTPELMSMRFKGFDQAATFRIVTEENRIMREGLEALASHPAPAPAPDALLDDAMGLLHNVDQRPSVGWQKDYEDVCARYEALPDAPSPTDTLSSGCYVCRCGGNNFCRCSCHSTPVPGLATREALLGVIECYCGTEDEGMGADKPWSNWKNEFADRIMALGIRAPSLPATREAVHEIAKLVAWHRNGRAKGFMIGADDLDTATRIMALIDGGGLREALEESNAAIIEYLEWGPMTGSDRDYHAMNLKRVVMFSKLALAGTPPQTTTPAEEATAIIAATEAARTPPQKQGDAP